MVRKSMGISLIFILTALSFANPAQATELAPQGTWKRKFQRGLLNTVFSPLELTQALAEEKNKDLIIPSWFFGLVKGSVLTMTRATTGIYEVISSPIPSPGNYEPIYQPEFSLEYLGFLKNKT